MGRGCRARIVAAVCVHGHGHEIHDTRPLDADVDSVVCGTRLRTRDPAGDVLVAMPNLRDFVLLCAMGVLGTITQACYINGMSEGDAAAMAPIDYTRLVFAVILGYALFSDIPNTMTMLGAGIVMASTIYITLRESR